MSTKRTLIAISLSVTLLIALSLALLSVDKATTVHTIIIGKVGIMVTNQATITTNPTSASPFRAFVTDADNRFFIGRIAFTVEDDVDGAEALVPRVTVQVFDGANYVTTIAVDGVDDANKSSDLPIAGFDPAGTSNGQETFRIFLAATNEVGAARDLSATIRYVFVAHAQT